MDRPPLEAEHEALFHSTLIGVALVSSGRFVRVNDEFVRLIGLSRFDLETQSAALLEPEPAAGRQRYEHSYLRPDGQPRTLLIESVGLDSGRYLYSIVDITERQRRAAELENARALLVRAVNSMSDGFVMFDADDRIILCNQRRWSGCMPKPSSVSRSNRDNRSPPSTAATSTSGSPIAWCCTGAPMVSHMCSN